MSFDVSPLPPAASGARAEGARAEGGRGTGEEGRSGSGSGDRVAVVAGAPSPEEWLARQMGVSVGRSREALNTSTNLTGLPAASEAVRPGRLSPEQAGHVAGAAAHNPDAERDLIDFAEQNSMSDLKHESRRRRIEADPDREATDRRIRSERRAWSWTDEEGAWNLSARGTVVDGAGFDQVWNRLTEKMFAQARREGRRERREAYAFDALMKLAELAGLTGTPPPPAAPSSPSGPGGPSGPASPGRGADAAAGSPGGPAGRSAAAGTAASLPTPEATPAVGGSPAPTRRRAGR